MGIDDGGEVHAWGPVRSAADSSRQRQMAARHLKARGAPVDSDPETDARATWGSEATWARVGRPPPPRCSSRSSRSSDSSSRPPRRAPRHRRRRPPTPRPSSPRSTGSGPRTGCRRLRSTPCSAPPRRRGPTRWPVRATSATTPTWRPPSTSRGSPSARTSASAPTSRRCSRRSSTARRTSPTSSTRTTRLSASRCAGGPTVGCTRRTSSWQSSAGRAGRRAIGVADPGRRRARRVLRDAVLSG